MAAKGMEATQNLSAMALVLAAAVGCGLFMNRLRMPAAAGFILVGMLFGPTGLGLIEASTAIKTLADLGVLMLLFIIGMELRLKQFQDLLPLAIGIALVEILIAVAFTTLMAQIAENQTASAVVIGFMLAISSTAIAVKMMEDAEETQSRAGKLTIAVLVAQDLAVVPLLLLTNSLGPEGTHSVFGIAVKLILAIGLLSGFITLLAQVKSFRFPASEYLLKNFDIGTLGVLGICFTAAAGSGILGLSPALGAFLGGLAVGHSTLRRAALRMAAPVQSILLFIFFLSVGLLIDLGYVFFNLWLIVIVLAVVTVGKTLVNLMVLRLFGQPGEVAFPSALFLSPVGEFSFVLASAGLAAGALSPEGYKLAIVVVALSLLVSPLWFIGARRAHMLALRGITEADALFRESYARELWALRIFSKKAAHAGEKAVHAAAAAGSGAVKKAGQYYREKHGKQDTAAKRPPAASDDNDNEAYGDIPSPGILSTNIKNGKAPGSKSPDRQDPDE